MSLPTFDELPNFKNYPGCAWNVWPENDELGTINLLTEDIVKRAAQEEIRLCFKQDREVLLTELVRLLLIQGSLDVEQAIKRPVNFPENPMFKRKSPEVTHMLKVPGLFSVRDDDLYINTQSGTQWDGMKHFGVLEHGVYYKGVAAESLPLGRHAIPDPLNIDSKLSKLGIQSPASSLSFQLLILTLLQTGPNTVFVAAAFSSTSSASIPRAARNLPYDPFSSHAIGVADLEACAKKQGVEFRQGDILILRVGFIQKYNVITNEARAEFGVKEEHCAGIDNTDDMKRFIWNNHFAAVASDQPALERWPPAEGTHHLHQTLLGLWGMPIGEFFDVEDLAAHCKETGRYTFHFSSWPLAIIGGCASPANAGAQF